MTTEDQLRARAIERLMCMFTLDLHELKDEFGPFADTLSSSLAEMATRFAPFATLTENRLDIAPAGRALTRIIASTLDQHVPDGIKYSRAS